MPDTSRRPKAESGSEVKAELDAERAGHPFLVYRDGDGTHRIVTLDQQVPVWVGRRPSADLSLSWDKEVSGVHAQLEPAGGEWTLVDDGLSRNGSFVNGERVAGRRRLEDGDMMRIGRTPVLFRRPGVVTETNLVADQAGLVRISDAQRRVLVALCRPLAEDPRGVPATNRQIAEDLHLSQNGVKTHIRALFAKLGIDELPQYSKRTELAHRALDLGIVGRRDVED
jgi:DNA-binding CsgD family transcriptional regulator